MLHAGMLRPPRGRPDAREGPTPDWPRRLRELASSARDARLQAFYAAGSVEADTPLSAVPLMAMDIETTGLDPARNGIVSIGIVPMSLALIRASASRQWLLRPRAPLGEESVTIHGITHARVEAAPDLDDVLGDVLEAIAGHVLVVHYRDIERQFLDAAITRRIGEGIQFPVIDTMELESRLHRGPRPGLIARLFRRAPEPVSIRLADSRSRYGLPHYRPHDALTDALATAELLQAQVAHRFEPNAPVKTLWT